VFSKVQNVARWLDFSVSVIRTMVLAFTYSGNSPRTADTTIGKQSLEKRVFRSHKCKHKVLVASWDSRARNIIFDGKRNIVFDGKRNIELCYYFLCFGERRENTLERYSDTTDRSKQV
jgi:hypothetical protein